MTRVWLPLYRALGLATCLATAAPLAASATDPASIPVSTVKMPAFPFVQLPKEAPKPFNEESSTWERVYVLAGDRLKAVEGRYYRRLFSVDSAGLDTERVLQHFAREIGALGGAKLVTLKKNDDAILRRGGQDPKRAFDKLRQLEGSSVIDQYLIRAPKGNVWISVGIFDDGQNGSIVVVEEQAFRPSVAPLPRTGQK